MFEIGERLRQARIRQGLELSDVEAATRIASRYLAALEEERFERLPGLPYARVFLRSYAEVLGLDATLFLDEFDGRFAEPEPPPPPPRRRLPLRPPGRTTLAIAAAAVAVLASVLAFAFSAGGRHHTSSPPRQQARSKHAVPPRPARPHLSAAGRSSVSRLMLTASRGECWLSVHAGSATGPLLYQGILAQGHSLEFFRRWLWIRIGAPSTLTVTRNGSPVTTLPTQTGNVLITPAGVQPA